MVVTLACGIALVQKSATGVGRAEAVQQRRCIAGLERDVAGIESRSPAQCLLCALPLTKDLVGTRQAEPAVEVIRRLLEAGGQVRDHAADHLGTLVGRERRGGGRVLRFRHFCGDLGSARKPMNQRMRLAYPVNAHDRYM